VRHDLQTNPSDRRERQLGRSVSDAKPKKLRASKKKSNHFCIASGLEADQKVIAAYGCYAMTATTALTAQNTTGVFDIHQTPPEFVKKQIELVLDDVGADVVKTGKLGALGFMQRH
jgi:hypothetical protein